MDRYTKDAAYSYALGMSISIELLINRPKIVKRVYCSSRINKNEYFVKLNQLCKINGLPLIEDDRLIERLSVKENCYVIAVFDKFAMKLADGDHLILCGFKDEGVLGTILRTAVSFDHRNIVLIDSQIDIFEPKVIRSSMGAMFYANIVVYPSLSAYLEAYSDHHCYHLGQSGSELSRTDFKHPYALIFDEGGSAGHDNLSSFYIEHDPKYNLPSAYKFAIALENAYHKKRLR